MESSGSLMSSVSVLRCLSFVTETKVKVRNDRMNEWCIFTNATRFGYSYRTQIATCWKILTPSRPLPPFYRVSLATLASPSGPFTSTAVRLWRPLERNQRTIPFSSLTLQTRLVAVCCAGKSLSPNFSWRGSNNALTILHLLLRSYILFVGLPNDSVLGLS